MIHKKISSAFLMVLAVTSIILLSCCSQQASPTLTNMPPTVTPTITPTPLPSAALVNGENILLSDYEIELSLFQSAQADGGAKMTAEEQRKQVLDDLIDEVLLAQEASKNGFIVDKTLLDSRLQKLETEAGGKTALESWQKQSGYTQDSFERALSRSIAAAWQRDKILASVPQTADQVHALQILVSDEAVANKIYQELESGVLFTALASRYDPLTGGDLGWFPKGYLTQPDVEKAAFDLKPGQYSQIIHTTLGYHIIQVVERDPKRQLSIDAYRLMQHQALSDWLKNQREQSKIEILLP